MPHKGPSSAVPCVPAHMGMPEIEWTRQKAGEFVYEYRKSVGEGKMEFMFEGRVWARGYAEYFGQELMYKFRLR